FTHSGPGALVAEGPIAVADPGEEGGHRAGNEAGLHVRIFHRAGDQCQEDRRVDHKSQPADDAELGQLPPKGTHQCHGLLPQPAHAACPCCPAMVETVSLGPVSLGVVAMNSCAAAPLKSVGSSAGMNTDSPGLSS